MGGVNRTMVLGTLSTEGVPVPSAKNGTPCASFPVVVSERGHDNKEHSPFVDCEVWGTKAEVAGELEAGALVLFEGTLRKRQKREGQRELLVSGFALPPLLAPTLTGSSN